MGIPTPECLLQRWAIHHRRDCCRGDQPKNFAYPESAARWVRQITSDLTDSQQLRRLAAQHSRDPQNFWRMGYAELARYLGHLLEQGTLHAHWVPLPPTDAPAAQPASPATVSPAPAPKRSPAPGPRPAPEPEPNTFSQRVDPATTAATLRQAAQNGVPFCQECAKQAAAARGSAA